MDLDEILGRVLEIDTHQELWARALKKLSINVGDVVERLDCFDAYLCKITVKSNIGKDIIKNFEGCIVMADKVLVILGAQKNELPLTMFIGKSSIRVLQVTKKMFNTIGTIITDNEKIEITVQKKYSDNFEKALNKVRMA